MTELRDYIIFSVCSFLGNVGVAVTGFGMAIIFLFVLQIAILSGYSSNFKYAIFIQTISLLCVQPLLIHKAGIKRHASRRMLFYFLPTTVISTPLGQLTAEYVSADTVKMAGGILVTFIAILEIQQKRGVFLKWIMTLCYKMEPIKDKCASPAKKKGYEKLDEPLPPPDPIKKEKVKNNPLNTNDSLKSNNSSKKYQDSNGDTEESATDEESVDPYKHFNQQNFHEGNSIKDQLMIDHNNHYDFRILNEVKKNKRRQQQAEFVIENWEDHVDFVRVKQEVQRQNESRNDEIGQEWEGHISISSRSLRSTTSRREHQLIIEIMREPIGPLGSKAIFWTLLASAASGYLGGFCGIRGPPIILYFLHPPAPVSFTKDSQRATGAVITAVNVTSRFFYYIIRTFVLDDKDNIHFNASDYWLYISITISSFLGVLIGSEIFNMMKDSRKTVRCILSIFLLICGISLLLASFVII